MINIFTVFDFSFAYWIAFGAVTVFVVFGAKAFLEDKQVPMKWWKWVVLALWYMAFFGLIAAPFTVMGEGETAAGWRMLAFNAAVVVVSGLIVWRLMLLDRKKSVS